MLVNKYELSDFQFNEPIEITLEEFRYLNGGQEASNLQIFFIEVLQQKTQRWYCY